MWEQSKAARRRYFDGAFHQRYFVGSGIDIGGGPDPLSQYLGIFPLMRAVRVWDVVDGDAQFMSGVADESLDFVHSSHCLEHLDDVDVALGHWLRILKPGGHLIVTVPDEELYEQSHWPSRFNPGHRWSFTTHRPAPLLPASINVLDLAVRFSHLACPERIVQVRDFFRQHLSEKGIDQTRTPVAECAIEFVLRKRARAA